MHKEQIKQLYVQGFADAWLHITAIASVPVLTVFGTRPLTRNNLLAVPGMASLVFVAVEAE
ncbi:MAG TPA: hypothetical protein PKE07_15200 [Lacibacter sp.]|nr:hypothetical protein [Lacibacter sp.]HMO90528.1 hypothetical protein [Lacibacter sp.]